METAQKRDDQEGEERHQSEGAEDVAEDWEEASLPWIVVVSHPASLSRRSFSRAADVSKDLFEKPEILRFAQDDNGAFAPSLDDNDRSAAMTTGRSE